MRQFRLARGPISSGEKLTRNRVEFSFGVQRAVWDWTLLQNVTSYLAVPDLLGKAERWSVFSGLAHGDPGPSLASLAFSS